MAVMAAVASVLCAQPAAAIINGTLDTTHECVGSLHASTIGFQCTGTLVHESWVLTSAACAGTVPNIFAMGADWAVSPRVYLVDHAVIHPSWDGSYTFDFAMLHLASPAVGEPGCALATVPDGIFVGMTFTTVGYGLTSYPSGFTTARHRDSNTVVDLNALQIVYDCSVSGPCLGDQGAPNFDLELVVGVVSAMGAGCTGAAVSGRVALVFDWILATVIDWSGIFFDGFETGDTSIWSGSAP